MSFWKITLGLVLSLALVGNVLASTPPKIGESGGKDIISEAGLLGSGEEATGEVSEHWLYTEGFPYWIKWLTLFAAGLAVLIIVIGGAFFLIGGAHEEQLEKAKKIVFTAVIGLIIALFSFFIVQVIENLNLPGT